MNVEPEVSSIPLPHEVPIKCVTVCVEETHIHDFVEATIENQRASIQEAGNLRFDVLQRADDTNEFLLYEVYDSPAAQASHESTIHYRKWRDQVGPWMAKPRGTVTYKAIARSERPEQVPFTSKNWFLRVLQRIFRRR